MYLSDQVIHYELVFENTAKETQRPLSRLCFGEDGKTHTIYHPPAHASVSTTNNWTHALAVNEECFITAAIRSRESGGRGAENIRGNAKIGGMH